MAQAVRARLDAHFGVEPEAARAAAPEAVAAGGIHIAICENLPDIEREWRAFEQKADGTVFQMLRLAGDMAALHRGRRRRAAGDCRRV